MKTAASPGSEGTGICPGPSHCKARGLQTSPKGGAPCIPEVFFFLIIQTLTFFTGT